MSLSAARSSESRPSGDVVQAHGPGRFGAHRVYVVPGDITLLSAHVLVYSTDSGGNHGFLYEGFAHHVEGFREAWRQLESTWANQAHSVGTTHFLPLVGEAQQSSRPNPEAEVSPGEGSEGEASPRAGNKGQLKLGTRPGAVVVTVVTDGEENFQEQRLADESAGLSHPEIYKATRAALMTAIEDGQQIYPKESRLLIALPMLGIGSGGAANEKLQAASCQLRAVKDVLSERDISQHTAPGTTASGPSPAIDVVIVAYTMGVYQVVLEARRREFFSSEAPIAPQDAAANPEGALQSINAPCRVEVPRDLLNSLEEGRGVLFIGAGLSLATGLPSWKTLIDTFAQKLEVLGKGVPNRENADADYFLDLAQYYRHHTKGSDQTVEGVIKDLFAKAKAKPTLAHYLLTALPVQFIITTNYDDLIEQALQGLRRFPVTVTTGQDVARTDRSGTHVVKFHGDAKQDQPCLILSRDDYDEFFTKHSALAALLEGLLLNHTFLFLGYSLRDPNFRQIVNRTTSILKEAKRPAYAVTFDTDIAQISKAGWQSKKVELIEVPGTLDEQSQKLWELLDWLAETVTGSGRLFLQPASDQITSTALDSGETNALKILRSTLAVAGEQAILAAESASDSTQARQVASVLEFLTSCGWRPQQEGDFDPDRLHGAWLRLARHVGDDQIAQRILVTALAESQGSTQAQALWGELDLIKRRSEGEGKQVPQPS